MKRIVIWGAAAAVAVASIVAGGGAASAADHADAPLTKANVPLDIADVYAFEGSGDNVVFAVTVNGLAMPGESPAFAANGGYHIKIDNDGDAVADIAYNVDFDAAAGGAQAVTVFRAEGADASGANLNGDVIIEGETNDVVEEGSMRFFAGLRDDPFFFDLNAFNAGLAFRDPGNNFFKGLNVLAIVLEVPAEDFLASGSTEAGVWSITSTNPGASAQVVDRMGRPAIATVFIPAASKDAFNSTPPDQDVAMWKDEVVASLQSLGADPALADALLPDILAFDTSQPMNFLNGRALADDVIDAELQLITGNSAASDNVANDSTFSTSFPYLAAANTQPAPTPVPATTPTAAAPAPTQPAATATRPTGVTAPDTGTGGGDDDGMTVTWVLVALGGAALVGGAAFAARRRMGQG